MLQAGISRKTLAAFLHTSVGNISTLGSRGSPTSKRAGSISEPAFGRYDLNRALAQPLTSAESEPLRKRRGALDPAKLADELEQIFLDHALNHTYTAAIPMLREYRP